MAARKTVQPSGEKEMTDPKEIARKLREGVDLDKWNNVIKVMREAADLLDPPPEGAWGPEYGVIYYYADDEGHVWGKPWREDEVDHKRLALGNVYCTREEAERAALRMRAMKKLRKAKGVTIQKDMGIDPLVILTITYRVDTPQNAAAVRDSFTDEERDALLGGG